MCSIVIGYSCLALPFLQRFLCNKRGFKWRLEAGTLLLLAQAKT
jgi:hypothetical protein